MASLLEQLIVAIEKSGQTRYKIAKATGVDQGTLSRLVHGETEMTVANIERILDHLGLRIVLRRKRKGK